MQPKTLLCIYIPMDLLNVVALVTEVSTCSYDYSNHLRCSSSAQMHSSLAPKAFISSAKSVRPQYQTCSSLAINMFICNVIRIWRWGAKTISSVAINAFVFYSEVGLQTHQKEQKLWEKVSEKKLHFKLGLDL